ncbi:AsmA family protein [Trinickia dabaoshanensis]|uniref:AsmA family protein n=1 Tax=Trinickia dabaoshanensis TaxID=564714 RepID=A0A2N7VGU6_9BURK|nr:AsmA family protein [Trinickia dabaoshanensis]PMS16378.1 AsmA family protein [Trinickia dabaoshanensis]
MPHPATAGRIAGKILAWIVVVVLVLCAALAIFVVTFDWNRARPWVDDKVTQAIGRPFAINGDLRVGWQHPTNEHGWRAWVPWPRFTAYDVTIGNPPWASSMTFARLDSISFDVKVLPLLAHVISIPSIDLVNPSVDLERLKDGRENWTFTLPKSSTPSNWTLRLADLTVAKAHIALSDAMKQVSFHVNVDTLGKPLPIGEVMKEQEKASRGTAANVIGERGARKLAAQEQGASGPQQASAEIAASSPQPSSTVPASASSAPQASDAQTRSRSSLVYALAWQANGTYRKADISGTGKLGGVLALRDPTRPFPMQADIKIGDTRLALVGTLTDPVHLSALDLRVWLQGQDLAHLYSILGVTLPQTPPYATDGHLVGHFQTGASEFTYSDFTGRVGGSDLAGTLTYAQRKPRPSLTGHVTSNLLQFSDLAPIIGADSNASKARRGESVKQPSTRALPVEPFHTDRWKAIDANVTFKGRRIIKDPALPITDLDAHVILKDGVLTFEPLNFGVAGGTLSSDFHLDGSKEPLQARMKLSARHLKLKQLFPTQKTMQSAMGEINGDASLSATGNSPAALAGTLDGEVKALVTQGKLSRLILEAAGLNVANVVYEKLFGTHDVEINCMAADFNATNGVLDTRTFALDTSDAVVGMAGKIDLKDETMDLTIHPHTKGFRIFTLRSPLYVKGTFKKPDVGVDKTSLALRAGAAVGLGLINPFAALIPLIAPSHTKSTPCDALLAQMTKAPKAPPPGAHPAH